MDIAAIISLLSIVMQEIPGAIKTGEELYNLGVKFKATIDGKEPSEDDKAELRAAIAADLAEALIPLPPAQPGDPDYVKPVP